MKTQKERAFLFDLQTQDEWTRRFTELADKHILFEDPKKLLYMNAGTGGHCFELREKLDKKTAIFAACENENLLSIARDKAAAIKADVDFSMVRFEDGVFDVVVVDATLVRPSEVEAAVREAVRVVRTGGKVAFFLPSSGSFGEVFSLLWEVLFTEDLGDHGQAAEDRIAEIPTITQIEEIAENAGLINVETHGAREVFEYDNGGTFAASPLVSDFLLPQWLGTLSEEENTRVSAKLAELIDAEDGDMSFRFSVKAALLIGEKA